MKNVLLEDSSGSVQGVLSESAYRLEEGLREPLHTAFRPVMRVAILGEETVSSRYEKDPLHREDLEVAEGTLHEAEISTQVDQIFQKQSVGKIANVDQITRFSQQLAKLWRSQIERPDFQPAQSPVEVIELLRSYVSDRVYDRLQEMLAWEDPEHPDHEPDQEPMNLEALKKFAEFMVESPEVPDPGIGIDSDGSIGLSWRLEPFGLLSATFSSRPMVSFGATSSIKNPLTKQRIPSEEQWRFSGTFPNNKVLKEMISPPISFRWDVE